MAVSIGPRIGIEGEAEYRQQLQKIISETKTLHSEMKSMESAFNSDTSAKEKAAKQTEALNNAILAQEERVREVSKGLEESRKKFGENDEKTLRWRQALAQAETELNNLQNQLREIPNRMQLLGQSMQEAGQKINQVGKSMTSAGRTLTRTVTAPIAALGTAAVKTTVDFDTSMSKVQAISGATGQDFEALRTKARQMGAETKYSASEAADAMTYMAMAGWKTEDMLQGVEGIMYLAAASGEDLATTSDIVTDALTAFGKSAEESGHLADIMAAASSNANTNVGLMGETFKYVAPVAGALGLSMEDTAVAIGLMANSGIKGSQAGTTLRNILTRMAKPTKESKAAMDALGVSLTNSDGSMRSLEDIMQDLRVGFSDLTEAEQAEYAAMLAGQRGMSGLLAIVNAAPADYEKLRKAVDNSSGSAKSMATTMQDNLAGELTILKSQLQELAISFGDILVPEIRKGVEWLQNQVTAFSQLDDKTKGQIIKFAALAAAVGPTVTALGKLTSGTGALIKAGGKVIEMLGAGGAGSAGIIGGLGSLGLTVAGMVAGTALLGAAANKLYDNFADADSVMSKTNKTLHASTEEAHAARVAYERSGQSLVSTLEDVESSINSTLATSQLATSLGDELTTLADKTSRTTEEQARMRTLVDQLNVIYPELGLSIDDTTGALNKGSAEIKTYISEMSRMSEAQAYQEAYNQVIQEIIQNEADLITAEAERDRLQGQVSASTAKYANSTALLGTEQGKTGKEIQALNEDIAEYSEVNEDAQKKAEYFRQKCAALGVDVGTLSDSMDESADAAEDAAVAFGTYGDAAEDASDDVVGATDEIIAAYNEAYDAALKSLGGQGDLYSELAETESVSYEKIVANMNAHIAAMENWNANVVLLTEDARYGVDQAYTGMVNDAISLGQDHAEVLDAYAQQYRDHEGDLSDAAESWAEAQDVAATTADLWAKNEAVTEYGLDAVNEAIEGGFDDAVAAIEDAEKPVGEAAQSVGETVGDSASDGVTKSMPEYKTALKGLPGRTLDAIKQTRNNAAEAKSAGRENVNAATTGVNQGMPAYNTALGSLSQTTYNGIMAVKNQAADARTAGRGTTDNLSAGTAAGMPTLESTLTGVRNRFTTTLTTVNALKSQARSAGQGTTDGLAAGAAAGVPTLGNTLSGVQNKFTSTLATVNGLKGQAKSAGQGYVDSSASGVNASTQGSLNTATNSMTSRFKTALSNVLALKTTAYNNGLTVGNNAASGNQQSAVQVKKSAEVVRDAMKTPVYKLIDQTSKWGYDSGKNYGDGIANSQTYVKAKANALAKSVANILKHSTPKEGPLKDDDVWGEHLADNFAKGMDNGTRTVALAAENLGYAAEAGVNEAVSIDPAIISGRAGLGATISHIIGGGIDPGAIYAAVREGAAAAETSVVIGEREFMRILRDAGVAVA